MTALQVGGKFLAAATISLMALPALAAPKSDREIIVPLVAESVASDQMRPRTVALGEMFLVQRLSSVQSATLQSDTRVPLLFGSATLPKGTRMLLAKPRDGGGELYCSVYTGGTLFASGNQTRQWICLEDADGDFVFETAYQAPLNNGAFLPSFDKVTSPRVVSGAYRLDPMDDRFGFEVGFVYQQAKARSGLGDVVEKVRALGEGSWSDLLTGSVQSLTGYSTWISGMDFPEDVRLDRARFIVTSGNKEGITIEPKTVSTGDLGFIQRRCKGFGLKC